MATKLVCVISLLVVSAEALTLSAVKECHSGQGVSPLALRQPRASTIMLSEDYASAQQTDVSAAAAGIDELLAQCEAAGIPQEDCSIFELMNAEQETTNTLRYYWLDESAPPEPEATFLRLYPGLGDPSRSFSDPAS